MRKRTLFALAVLVLAVSATVAEEKAPPAQAAQMNGCMSMMQDMQKMAVTAKEQDDRLGQLVGDMNNASGQAKVDKMAAVITEMAHQRSQMREQIAGMMKGMMQGGGMSCAMPQNGAASATPAAPATKP